MRGGVGLTRLQIGGELLSDGEHQQFLPELLALIFRHAESPSPTVDVAGIFPDGLDATLEEVDRVLQLQGVHGEVIDGAPEGLEGEDIADDEGDALIVGLGVAVLVVVEVPRVLERGWAHPTEHCQALVFALCGAFGGGRCRGGIFRHGGQAVDHEGWEPRHGCRADFAEGLAAAVGDFGTLLAEEIDLSEVYKLDLDEVDESGDLGLSSGAFWDLSCAPL